MVFLKKDNTLSGILKALDQMYCNFIGYLVGMCRDRRSHKPKFRSVMLSCGRSSHSKSLNFILFVILALI